MLKIVLAGNPNSGKTSLFNALTGSNQHVGNWSGVTVEKKTGLAAGGEIQLIDLPGAYSLSPDSLEEKITSEYLSSGEYDGILNVLDATNLERNLTLTVQLARLGKPMLCAANLMDSAEKQGLDFDFTILAEAMGVPFLPVSARTGQGLEALPSRLKQLPPPRAASLPSSPEERVMALERLCQRAVRARSRSSPGLTERLDALFLHRWLGIPLFLLLLLGMFTLTFGALGSCLGDLLRLCLDEIAAPEILRLLQRAHPPEWCIGLISGAVLPGVGVILTFLPQIALLFFCLALLEDSGYMARAAFLTDRLLQRLGLSGKSFIPMLMGFGCTTTAAMAARTQENQSQRRMTILLLPFLSCGAKLTIYGLFTDLFFPRYRGLVVFSLYILGFFLGILCGLILKKTLFRQNDAPFLLELPPYRLPRLTSLLSSTWNQCKGFLTKAGTLIFGVTVVIWLLQHITPDLRYLSGSALDSSESLFRRMGELLAPVLAPLGFGDWQAAVSLLAGCAAKEAVVSSLTITGGLEGFTALSAYSYLVFCLLYPPCLSAVISMKREMGGWRWVLLSLAIQILFAYGTSLLVYQGGMWVQGVLR